MKKRTTRYTVMFVPDGNGRTISLSIHRYILFSLLIFLGLFFISIFVLLFKTSEIGIKLQLFEKLKKENAELSETNKNLRVSAQLIEDIEVMTAYLQRLSESEELEKLSALKRDAEQAKKEDLEKGQSVEAKMFHKAQEIYPEMYASAIPNILPVDGWVTRHYNPATEDGEGHVGIDFAAATGTTIRATAPGVVTKIENDRYLGKTVTLQHEFGFQTRYGHCSQILVSLRDRVNRGQTIAYVGNTGRSSAPHLHYEVLRDGKHVDPSEYIISHKD